MYVALIAVSLICLILTLSIVRLATRKPEGTERERLLERDIARLGRELEKSHDKLLHVVGREWVVPPAEAERAMRDEPEGEDDLRPWLSHDELADDTLLLEPDPYAVSM